MSNAVNILQSPLQLTFSSSRCQTISQQALQTLNLVVARWADYKPPFLYVGLKFELVLLRAIQYQMDITYYIHLLQKFVHNYLPAFA
jgi:hypothetical protein